MLTIPDPRESSDLPLVRTVTPQRHAPRRRRGRSWVRLAILVALVVALVAGVHVGTARAAQGEPAVEDGFCSVPTRGYDDHLRGVVHWDLTERGRHVVGVAWLTYDRNSVESVFRVSADIQTYQRVAKGKWRWRSVTEPAVWYPGERTYTGVWEPGVRASWLPTRVVFRLLEDGMRCRVAVRLP